MTKTVHIGLNAAHGYARKMSMHQDKSRYALTMALFGFAFAVVCLRLVALGLGPQHSSDSDSRSQLSSALSRPAIVDRAGNIVATDIVTGSLYVNPQKVVHQDETAEQLLAILPSLDAATLRRKLSGEGQFQWIMRKLAPRQQAMIHELGLPGLHFAKEPHRVYPAGAEAAHVLGQVDIDNKGLAGIEAWIDRAPRIDRPGERSRSDVGSTRLSMHLGVQHAMREELVDALSRYKAKAAAGVVLDVHSGEVVALASLPDYDPNRRGEALRKDQLNRLTSGVYELGSVFKIFTVAAGLDYGVTSMEKGYDATEPIRVGSHSIGDFHAKKRWLSTPEIFIYSSNIGSAKMALDVGVRRHREFLSRLGLLGRMRTELGETAAPIVPASWKRINTMTIAFGHGLSVTPLQFAAAAAALVNGGYRIEPTFLFRTREEARVRAERVISAQTSELMRYLFRLNVKRGSGKRANVEGYRVGGKTGTAEKVVRGRYSRNALLNSFISAFPMDDPQYVLLVMLDEPKGTKETGGRATAGVNAAAATGRIVERIAPILGVVPQLDRKPAFDEAVSASY